jgi:hypothetical protein
MRAWYAAVNDWEVRVFSCITLLTPVDIPTCAAALGGSLPSWYELDASLTACM